MAETGGRAALRRVLERMRADPAVLQQVVDAARAGSPPLAALPEQEVRRHIATLVAVVAGAFTDAGRLTEEQTRRAARLAADRAAQGVPLDALLHGFRAARTEAFRSIAAQLQDTAVPLPEFLELLVELDLHTAELQDRLISAYHESQAHLAAGARATRVLALRELLLEGAVDQLPATGLEPGRRYHCLVADIGDPRRAELLPPPPDGIAGLVEGHLCLVTVRPPAPPATPFELAVTAPAVPAVRLPGVYRLCRAALAAARARGLSGTRRLTELAVPVATDGVPELGALLATDLLARLDPADPAHRLLAATALAYLDRGRRVNLTAQALHVHPNTVKHRLRRLAALTTFGAPCAADDQLADTVRWRWALESWLLGSQ
ncbi:MULTISPECIES: helix-turn-helix domain-containing protein [unclassified Kitasatospora]|uniref:helix-turn-helix domain-containing protein n=1 Tax=unclassified Kitasatospora TaxID=2633591 RepID=UPI00340F6FD5